MKEHSVTVFLVDDQAIVGEMVRRMLAPEKDIVFHFCQDPAKAVKEAARISPTVILQDIVMPEIDGLTLVKYYRAHKRLKDVPLIVLSSKEEAATKADAFAVGANDYLVKLPDRIELVARIRYHSKGYIALLERNEAYDALYKSRHMLAAQLAGAAEHVMSLLPAPLKDGDIRTEWHYVPSAQLGGDSFGYHWIDEERFAVYLLDVCDHGVTPALLSVSALNTLKTQTIPNADFGDPAQVMEALNDIYEMEKHNNLYFTLWYGVFNKTTRELVYGSAGHPPALFMPREGGVVELMTENMFIGGMAGIDYSMATIQVPVNSKLYIFSDGVYEITRSDGSIWNLEGLKGYLMGRRGLPGGELEGLYRFVYEMNGGKTLDDDFSILRVDLL